MLNDEIILPTSKIQNAITRESNIEKHKIEKIKTLTDKDIDQQQQQQLMTKTRNENGE